MSKYEFISQLDDALLGNVSERERRDSVRYYTDYIEDEVRAGKSEEEVLQSLGSPMAIARSIIEAKGYDRGGETIEPEFEEQEEPHVFMKTKQISGWKVWATLGGILLAVLLIVSLIFKVLAVILPFLIPFAIIIFIIKLISGR